MNLSLSIPLVLAHFIANSPLQIDRIFVVLLLRWHLLGREAKLALFNLLAGPSIFSATALIIRYLV
ncbi:TPA: hypothetical protein DCX15_01845 [bacterium]|nr:hypothetical protein [bacterium]